MNHLPPRSFSRVAMGTGVLALTLLTTACVGGSTPSSGSTSPAAGSAAPSPGPGTTTGGGTGVANPTATAVGGAPGTSTTTGSGNTGPTGGSPQTCETQNLSATVTDSPGGAAAGSRYVDIVFENIGDAPCTMYGYPGVSLGAGSPSQQLGQPASRNPQVKPLTVTLTPNAHAFAVLQITDAGDYSPNQCDPKQSTDLRVYPPNNNTLLYASFSTTGCAANLVTLHVEAVQPGDGS